MEIVQFSTAGSGGGGGALSFAFSAAISSSRLSSSECWPTSFTAGGARLLTAAFGFAGFFSGAVFSVAGASLRGLPRPLFAGASLGVDIGFGASLRGLPRPLFAGA